MGILHVPGPVCVGRPANFAKAAQWVVEFHVVGRAQKRLSILNQIASGAKEAARGTDTLATTLPNVSDVDDENQMNRQRPNPVTLTATLSDTEGASISARVTKAGFDFIAAARVLALEAGSRQPQREVTAVVPDVRLRGLIGPRVADPSIMPAPVSERDSELPRWPDAVSELLPFKTPPASTVGAAANSAQFGRNVTPPTPAQNS